MPLPDALKNPPELMPGLEFYLSAFHTLNSCRSIGMSLGPIPWTAIVNYGNLYCSTEESFEDLQYHIKHLDNVYLTWANESNKDKPK